MITPLDVPPAQFLEALAERLKKSPRFKPDPKLVFLKTGAHKQRAPQDPDWWYLRCASLLRRLYIDAPVGVGKLRTYYGGRKRRGMEPAKFAKAGGWIIRKALQKLEQEGLVGKHPRGRVLTPKGRSLLDRVAYELYKSLKEA